MNPLLAKQELMGGDLGWRGVNLRLHPDQVPPGFASDAMNMRFTDYKPSTRLGKCPVVWLNKVVSGQASPWGTVYGQGNFLDPVSKQRFSLIAADGNVYYSMANNPTNQVTLPAGVTITGPVKFYQCFNVLIMARKTAAGLLLTPLVMTSLAAGNAAVTQTALTDPLAQGTLVIPPFFQAVNFSNRLFVLDGDNLLASDLLDYTRYTLRQAFRINQGEADQGVAVAPFGTDSLIVFKQTRVYKVSGVKGDLSAASADPVTKRYGCVAPESIVDTGSDLLWLSQEGVASLVLTAQSEVQAAQGALDQKAPMFSADIEPLIKRINWNYASGAQGIIWGQRYYLAVPLDDATSFRAELMGSGLTYDANGGPGITLVLEEGRTYRWIPGAEVVSANADLASGFGPLTGPRDFVASRLGGGSAPVLTVLASGTSCSSSLRRIFKGVNNAVLIYNFVNQAWEGYDQAPGIEVIRFFTFPINGKERLFTVGSDGWVNLYEERFEDQISEPYVDVTVATTPAVGNTVRVNGGTVGTAANLAANSGTTVWGCDTLANAQRNLYYLLVNFPLRPSTQVAPITGGARIFGLNGLLPTIVSTGSWATVSYYPMQGIETRFVTRGLKTDGVPLGVKQGRELVLVAETWAPSVSVSVIPEGVNAEVVYVTGQTRDRTKFDRPWDVPAFKEDNSDHNFETAYRQDYSIALGAGGIDLNTGIQLDHHQDLRLALHAPARARAAQVKVSNTTGRVRILGIGLKGFEVEKGKLGTRV